MSVEGLKERSAGARAWLIESALPLWAGAGFDADTGLFQEKLDRHGNPVAGPRRVRVQGRQLYVFAQAGRLGWSGPWRERALAGLATQLGPAKAADGGVGHLLDARGRLIDDRRDLYDQAFGLFALAQARTLDPERADARIGEVFGYLATQRGPNGGYLEGEIKPSPRWQNPHMHLFEAGIALHEAGSPHGLPLAKEIAGLFDRYFFDAENGALGEYYNDDLSRAPGDIGRLCEPGHHFEWIWLLDRWRKVSGEDRSGPADRLWTHATTNGLADGLAIDEVWRDGGARTPSARLWPQTERLKAGLVRFERSGDDRDAAAAASAFDGLMTYFAGLKPGLWRDRRGADGQFIDEPSPASSFYHIVLALSELFRVVEAL
jgi:mannose/cellobiose epimerase-like protein (N-acyl-D-glucosamine 2-epimerase family)